MTLKQYLQKAREEKWAVGHFNFSTADQLRAFVEAGLEMRSPIMAATSEGEADFLGLAQAAALVRSYQQLGYKVFLSADHFHSFEKCKEAIDAGYDSILIDASKLPYEENIALTRRVVEYAQAVNSDISIEGELGYLRGSSEVQEEVEISTQDYTRPEQAADFIEKTGVDRLAVVFGNIHGIVTKQKERLDLTHFRNISEKISAQITLVLHGASGLPAEDVLEAIKLGISNIHINTELRVAYHDALEKELTIEPDQTTPYKFLESSYQATKDLIVSKLKLFGSVGKLD